MGTARVQLQDFDAAAEARWPLIGVTVIHRYGTLAPGAQIVLVAVAAAHRREAFAAAEMLMDRLKTEAPFWKRARLRDGSAEPWVASEAGDGGGDEA
jgi:molybdopterin synthase catalytic subunit